MSHASERARLIARLVRARSRRRPHTLSHLITSRCNARCATCLWRDATSGEADTETVAWLYRAAGRAGLVQLVVWGGEPLLREDLGVLLRIAKKSGLYVTLITNGWSVRERWSELRGSVDVLILSVDEVGSRHDEMRGLPGLYGRVDEFALSLEEIARRRTSSINTVLSRQNEGVLPRVADVARRWRAEPLLLPHGDGRDVFLRARGEQGGPRSRPRRAEGRRSAGARSQGSGVPDPCHARLPRSPRARPGSDQLPLPDAALAHHRRVRRRGARLPSARSTSRRHPRATLDW